MTQTETPRIYVACLAAYNSGCLHGIWIDGDEADMSEAEIAAMLASSPAPDAEEYAIHDHEGFPAGAVGEFSNLEEVAEIARAVAEHGDAYAAARAFTGSHEEAIRQLEDCYHGEHESEADFVAGWYEERETEIPAGLVIDWEATWHGTFNCDGWHAVRAGRVVHIFSPG